MKPVAILVAALLALPGLGGCEPRPPKPKTELEKQASSEKHGTAPQPFFAKRPEQPAKP